MAVEEVRDIPLDDLVVSKGQVRVREVGKEIDELAESIRKMGLLEPIVVCPAEKEGKFEILTGQRRFLAHKLLGRPTIRATVRPERVDDAQAKALSLTENLVRRDLHTRDLIDACTALFKKYGSLAAVVDETGLPYPKVALYVKYDRLQPELRELVDSNKVPLKTALRAHDAASVSGEYNAEEAVRYAKEMANMSGAQQERIVKKKNEDPLASADEIIESAKTGDKIVQILVTLGQQAHLSLQNYAKVEGTTQDNAAADLITEALSGKGYLED
jgi:ParB family chromosome partitioning protein